MDTNIPNKTTILANPIGRQQQKNDVCLLPGQSDAHLVNVTPFYLRGGASDGGGLGCPKGTDCLGVSISSDDDEKSLEVLAAGRCA